MGAITDVRGIKVGNAQNLLGLTGVTVVLCEEGATASVQVLGGSPGTRETDLLRSYNTVDAVHGVFLAGGSAFGLGAAEGVMRYLEERRVGFDTGVARVPIVPGAIIFDLGVGNPASRPTPDMAYRACVEASSKPPKSGNVGAGAGATLGKLYGPQYLMKSGLGNSSVRTASGYTVGAIVVVNPIGDVYDPDSGQIVAGAYDRGAQRFVGIQGGVQTSPGGNTTIGVIATDCPLSKEECGRVALMAMGGLAQTVRPSFTPYDGDTLFVLSTGGGEVDGIRSGSTSGQAQRGTEGTGEGRSPWTGRKFSAEIAAEVGIGAQKAVVLAVLDAVRSAEGVFGIPAARDVARRT